MAEQLVQLRVGDMVDRWRIDKKLGEGAFGAVYFCSDATGKYALKAEGVNEKIKLLKMEVHVLTKLNERVNRHFCKIADKGLFGNFNYVVMTLVGKNLGDLMKANPSGHLSMGSAIGVGIQSLEALEDMHAIGYLHRDVKPGNYAIGRTELNEQRKVYVLDFGMCRKFTGTQNVIRRPRALTGFRGTVRYAPLSCHQGKEFARKDDVETWLYMQVELTVGRLPWCQVADMRQVGEYKQRCRYDPGASELCRGCPPELRQILSLVDLLGYYDKPPYQTIYNLMRQALTSTNSQEFPYDWEQMPDRKSVV